MFRYNIPKGKVSWKNTNTLSACRKTMWNVQSSSRCKG